MTKKIHPFRLDKTTFKASKMENQTNDKEYWLKKTPLERLEAAWYLTCCAYNIDIYNPPRLDTKKIKFSKRN